MAQDNVEFSRKFLTKFINMYKELNCLWDKNCPLYKNKKKRDEAITKLTDMVQKYNPNATRVHVMRKIESVRACVRREHRKVQDSRSQGTKYKAIHTPHLWYYDLLSFLFDEDENINRPTTSEKQQSPLPVTESEEEIDNDEPEVEVSFDLPIENYSNYTVTSNMLDDRPSLSKKFPFEEDNSKRHCTEVEDEYDAIGINVAAKLRGLPPSIRILAEKLINDVLYQAQTSTLNSSSVIATVDPFK